MSVPEFVDVPILVQAHFLPDGQVQPTAFRWQDCTHVITDVGRQWDAAADGVTWHCFLVRTAQREAAELRLDALNGRWLLHRVWANPLIL
jgi:hypothetical protein